MAKHDAAHYFQLESRELVDGLERGLLAARGEHDLRELFRLAHTLKGAARVVGEDALADAAHTLEDVLAHHRETGEPISERTVSELLRLIDAIRSMLQRTPANDVQAVGALDPNPHEGSEGRRREVLRIEAGEMDELAARVLDAEVHAGMLRKQLDGLNDLKRLALAVAQQAKLAAGTSARLRAGVDELLATVGEQHSRLTGLSDQLELDLRQLTEQASDLRLLEISSLFPELERSAHDAASNLGRAVRFSTDGGNVRVDAHILGCLRASLGHLIRNAIAHGLEDDSERRALGKPAAGEVRLEIRREGRRIRVSVRDDGRGIDCQAVQRAAEKLGLSAEDEQSSAETWIFAPA